MSKAIALLGSARRNGNTGHLIDWIAAELNSEVIDLGEQNILPYDYEHKNSTDDFLPVMRRILTCEKILFASPVYWYAVSAQMKVFIDRTSDFLDVDELKHMGRELRGKRGYVVCTSISQEADISFINAFKDTFNYLGMEYGGHVHADCSNGYITEHYQADVEKFLQRVR